MAFTSTDLETALDKLSTLEFTDAEIEAIGDVLANGQEVEGFGPPLNGGHDFIRSLSNQLGGLDLGSADISNGDLGSGRISSGDLGSGRIAGGDLGSGRITG